MYLIIGFAVVLLVIALAWHGVGLTRGQPDERISDSMARHPSRARAPQHEPPRRVIAPDDDPEFLSQLDRRLRDEGKSNNS